MKSCELHMDVVLSERLFSSAPRCSDLSGTAGHAAPVLGEACRLFHEVDIPGTAVGDVIGRPGPGHRAGARSSAGQNHGQHAVPNSELHAQTHSFRSLQRPASQPPALAATGTPTARELFGQHRVKCHGADGTGMKARDRLPEIPDFTSASWKAQRTDARLMASVLGGKGEEMPSWRGKLSERQARGWHELEHPHHPERGLRHGRRDGPQRWDRRDRQLERRHPGELRAPPSRAHD
jgi:mono/diheme cytochrome c family protein